MLNQDLKYALIVTFMAIGCRSTGLTDAYGDKKDHIKTLETHQHSQLEEPRQTNSQQQDQKNSVEQVTEVTTDEYSNVLDAESVDEPIMTGGLFLSCKPLDYQHHSVDIICRFILEGNAVTVDLSEVNIEISQDSSQVSFDASIDQQAPWPIHLSVEVVEGNLTIAVALPNILSQILSEQIVLSPPPEEPVLMRQEQTQIQSMTIEQTPQPQSEPQPAVNFEPFAWLLTDVHFGDSLFSNLNGDCNAKIASASEFLQGTPTRHLSINQNAKLAVQIENPCGVEAANYLVLIDDDTGREVSQRLRIVV